MNTPTSSFEEQNGVPVAPGNPDTSPFLELGHEMDLSAIIDRVAARLQQCGQDIQDKGF